MTRPSRRLLPLLCFSLLSLFLAVRRIRTASSLEPPPVSSFPFAPFSSLSPASASPSPFSIPLPPLAEDVASPPVRLASAELADEGAAAAQSLSFLHLALSEQERTPPQRVPLEVTVIENRVAAGHQIIHPALGSGGRPVAGAAPESAALGDDAFSLEAPAIRDTPEQEKEANAEMEAAGMSAAAPVSPELQRALADDEEEEQGQVAAPTEKGAKKARGNLGRFKRWLKKKLVSAFTRIFNVQSVTNKAKEADAIDRYLEDATRLNEQLACVNIRDQKSRKKKMGAVCKKFKGSPKLQALCATYSAYIDTKLESLKQCGGLSLRACLQQMSIPLVQPLLVQAHGAVMHDLEAAPEKKKGRKKKQKAAAAAGLVDAEFSVSVSEEAIIYLKGIVSKNENVPGSFLAPSCVYLDQVERNENTKARKLKRASKKKQKGRPARVKELYHLVHLLELGAPLAFDSMFVSLLLQTWDVKKCPSEVRKLRRKRHQLQTKEGATVKATGGDIFQRAMLVAIMQATVPSTVNCLESDRPSRNCLLLRMSPILKTEWRKLVNHAAAGNRQEASALLDKLRQTLQSATPSPRDVEKIRKNLQEQLQQIVSIAGATGRAGRKVLNVIGKWKWLTQMITRLMVLLGRMHGNKETAQAAKKAAKKIAKKGDNSQVGTLVSDAALLEMGSSTGATMKCATGLAGYGKFVEKSFRALASAEIRRARKESRAPRGKTPAATSFVNLSGEGGVTRDAAAQRTWRSGSREQGKGGMRLVSPHSFSDETSLAFFESGDDQAVEATQPKKATQKKKFRQIFIGVVLVAIFLFIQAVLYTPSGAAIFIGVLLAVVVMLVYMLPNILAAVRKRRAGGGGEADDDDAPLFDGDASDNDSVDPDADEDDGTYL
ncbi:hypothetical protein BESB_061390 [Besnoitia besnoiti]|uniref:Transmembrane protein n=1 Tax=Besnoitia besnoiti TaxID=94643 RepID=A0A2A9MIN7_BESBE|nr:hypothetical protein BESB_061390 [Besnoitia besnoiti]PFH35252.1 hypothetical protein BESB_061390 [Besnoitia besnoiti]